MIRVLALLPILMLLAKVMSVADAGPIRDVIEGESDSGTFGAHSVDDRDVSEERSTVEDHNTTLNQQTHQVDEELSNGEFYLNNTQLINQLPSPRTFGANHCSLKVVCYLEKTQTARDNSYRSYISGFFSETWDRFHPKFLGNWLGYDGDSFAVGDERTHNRKGCIVRYNSCPMRVLRAVQFAAEPRP